VTASSVSSSATSTEVALWLLVASLGVAAAVLAMLSLIALSVVLLVVGALPASSLVGPILLREVPCPSKPVRRECWLDQHVVGAL
jgi:hypothetical protein